MSHPRKLPLQQDNQEATKLPDLEQTDFPLLYDLLAGPRRADLEKELSQLLSRYWHPRDERWHMSALARLLFIGDDVKLHTEPSIIEDISMSGIRLSIKRSAHLELMSLTAARVQVIGVVDGREEVLDIPSWMVRVAAVGETSVSLAFRYASLEPDQAQLLQRLRGEVGA